MNNLNKFIILILLSFNIFAGDEKADISQEYISNDHTLLAPERNFICSSNFCLLNVRPDFAQDLEQTYSDPDTMRLFGRGHTLTLERVRAYFASSARELFSAAEIKGYLWVIISPLGISGIFGAHKNNNESFDVSYILSSETRGRGLTQEVLAKIISTMPDNSWTATAHPDNIASCRILEQHFLKIKTEFCEKFDAPRNYYARPSQHTLDGQEIIYFTYSGKEIALELCDVAEDQQLAMVRF